MAKLFGWLTIMGILMGLNCGLAKAQDTLSHQNNKHKEYYLTQEKRGERLFLGLYTVKAKVKSCVSCHNLNYIDTLNWNPSAREIAQTSANRSVSEFKGILMNPLGNKMAQSHVGYSFSDEEVVYLKAYLSKIRGQVLVPKKPKINHLILFFFLGVLITLSLVDLFFTRRIKYKVIPVAVLVLALGYQTKMLAHGAINLGRTKNYAPIQPIKFSHQIHATNNRIDCRYCHNELVQSKSAGIPPITLCLNCHLIVREGTNSGKFEINKIHTAVDSSRPVEWVRVHKLPDYVFFSHAQHVNVGKRECKECHGKVEEMNVLRQENDLAMGWCLNCHDRTKVEFRSSEYFSRSFGKLHEELDAGVRDSVTVSLVGGRECGRCHY